jgi:Tol biopolymer transport system component
VKLFAAALIAIAALSVSGGAAPSSSSCCHGAPLEDFDPQWSSDGSQIAFIRAESSGLSALYTMAIDGGNLRQLLSLGNDYQANATRQRPLLSPDWTRLALIERSSALKIESVDSSQRSEVGTNVVSFAWSPDGRQITFHETDLGNNSELFVVNSNGTGLRNLGPGQSPAWSPAGDRIAFIDPAGKLYVMQANGTARRLVYDGNGAVLYAPSWSPHGDRLAFFARSNLLVASADGGLLKDIPTDYDSLKPPRWSFDGTLIAVEPPNRLSIVRLETRIVSTFENRRDASWSPTANELVASFDGPCQRNGIYRMSLSSTSRRLTLDCHIRGTDDPDALEGTPLRDIIAALAGDDEVSGRGGEDRLLGGPGDDTLLGGDLADRVEGGYGADLLIGGSFPQDPFTQVDDRLLGGPGPDDLSGGPGRDVLSGDVGNDVLRGGADEDVLLGGPGNDRIFASGDNPENGLPLKEVVDCGAGRRDIAFVDRSDRVRRCETVHRR